MRIVLQRVSRACVLVDGKAVGEIGRGLLLLVGIHQEDNEESVEFLARKCAELRIFADDQGKMNRSALETGAAALVVSQFTLYGDCQKGRRPSFDRAARPEKAEALYKFFAARLGERLPRVQTGVFGAQMEVELTNDGPVTFILEK